MSKRRLQMQKRPPSSVNPEQSRFGPIFETILLPEHILAQARGILEPRARRYRMGTLDILVGFTTKSGYHISIAGAGRYPTLEEIRVIRYTLGPKDKMMGMMLPPVGEDLKTGPNTVHLWEVAER